ncbi:MAG: M15 family metallopeptidase [Clostridia bacterium]|nr:M15 family metallopeptidase [Clostridia bacterium]
MKTKHAALCAICSLLLVCSSCTGGRADGSYYANNKTYADFNLMEALGISFNDAALDMSEPESGEILLPPATGDGFPNEAPGAHAYVMRVYEKMDIYERIGGTSPSKTLSDGTLVTLTEIENSIWTEVYSTEGELLGYAKDGFMHATAPSSSVYASLPIEYGMAKTNDNTYVEAYSHLVDIRQYLRVFSSTNEADWRYIDLNEYDVIVAMQLSTSDTTIHEPFYNRNLCLVQYDLLPKLKEAISLLRQHGYTMVIYDAYRPTSVQQRWFNIVRNHKWVADPSRGMGGIHDRGTAVDISIVDSSGRLVEMPTAMHTFTEEASRLSQTMTATARKNMDYLKDVMVQCGFSIINSEWWHFQDVNTVYYLPTDHPIDEIPLIATGSAPHTK